MCNIVSSEEGDLDYIFPGSDDDFDAEDLQEEYDYLDREQENDELGLCASSTTPPSQSIPISPGNAFPSVALSPSNPFPSVPTSPGDPSLSVPTSPGNPSLSVVTSPGNLSPSDHSPSTHQSSDTPSTGRGIIRGRGRGQGRGRGRGRGTGSSVQIRPGGEEQNEWSSEFSQVDVEPFTEPVGPTISLGSEPLETFLSLFTPALIEHIVVETNKYATLCLTSTHQGDGPPPTWETDASEISDSPSSWVSTRCLIFTTTGP